MKYIDQEKVIDQGDELSIEGKLVREKWQDDSGQTKTSIKVLVSTLIAHKKSNALGASKPVLSTVKQQKTAHRSLTKHTEPPTAKSILNIERSEIFKQS